MALTLEWSRRIQRWREELPNHFYRPIGSIQITGFLTHEQLTPAQTLNHPFSPVAPGDPWGSKWQYGWFQGQVVIPPEAAGACIVACPNVGGESVVYLNGKNVGAKDKQHTEILLSASAKPGETYSLLIEAYAGHGPMVCHAGPIPPGRQTVPEPPATQTVVGDSTFGYWDEVAYQLWLDVTTLWEIRYSIDENALRVAEIDRALRQFTTIVDFEQPLEDRLASFAAAREHLRPLLECVNGSTAPTLFTVGHAHIDVAWLWPLAETIRKCARTFSTAVTLMEQYPEYKFLQSQPHLYRYTQKYYPELYQKVKEAVARGQFIPEGGMWVEADTNVPSGESLIRQFVHGKRFFREEFGVDNEILWLPDVFGYSGALPQIMQGCGIHYFATAKIFWAYNGGDPFPYNTFTWEGIDGSTVLVHLMNEYNSQTNPASLIERWNQRVQKDDISTRLVPFGWGDGGGGPTRDHLEFLRRQRNLEGVPQTRITSPNEFFHDQEARGIPAARYVGELYFQAHRGTYTSQARVKRGNRHSELALREAEMWQVAAQYLTGYAIPNETMDEAWKTLLLNQFHDILPGSSIHRVYEEAEAQLASIVQTAHQAAQTAAGQLLKNSNGLTVFNSLAWARPALVELPANMPGASIDGAPLPSQTLGEKTWVEVPAPSAGWTSLEPAPQAAPANPLCAAPSLLENEFLKVLLNHRGEITSIWDKTAQREWTDGLCNSFHMYKDVTTNWDNWDLDSTYASVPVELSPEAEICVLAEGPLFASLRVTRKLNQSVMTQTITLKRGSRRIDFQTHIDWVESHKLLKVNFPVAVYANDALHEIQFGHIRRPNHLSRPFDQDRFEVSCHKWTALTEENRGAAVLNDSKYGVNVLGTSINLTLLKSGMAPDMTADRGAQDFTYSFYCWNTPFIQSDLVHQAYDLNVPVLVLPGTTAAASLFQVEPANIILDTVKPAEDGSGDIVLRLYESGNTTTRCQLFTSIPCESIGLTNMLETGFQPLDGSSAKIELDFHPFEVKTLRIKPV